jgi:hypothetical protein
MLDFVLLFPASKEGGSGLADRPRVFLDIWLC